MRVLALAQLTLTELWRQKTQWGFILVALFLALPALLPLDGIHINGTSPVGRELASGILAFVQFVALFLAIASASGLISNDIERGTVLLLLSKPIPRYQIVLGKLLGGGAFMTLAWIAWGLVAGLALGLRLGPDVFLPTLIGFAASSLASWLVVAFCLFWSCWMPANATMGLTVIGWLMANLAPKIAGALEGLGHPRLGQAVAGIGEALPLDRLSDVAKRLIGGDALQVQALWSVGLIGAWWVAAAVVFSRRDLAPGS